MTESKRTPSSGPNFSGKTRIASPLVAKETPAILLDQDSREAHGIRITTPKNTVRFAAFCPCPLGIETVLVHELQRIGVQKIQADRAGVHFEASWEGILKVNLYSRLATRVLLKVAEAPISSENDLYRCAASVPWEDWFTVQHTIRLDTTAIHSTFQSIQFANLRVKDAICDRFRHLVSERPSVDTKEPDIKIHSFLTADKAVLYLDTSGESLFKRGWRVQKGAAPLRENLASGIIALLGWRPHQALLDPFCGSGTLLIEATLQAYGVPAGFSRSFAFENLTLFEARVWNDLISKAQEHIQPRIQAPIAGADLDPLAIEAAKVNAEHAGLTEEDIYFEVADVRDTCPLDEKTGWIITNPPYGERLELDDPDLMREWSATLKSQFNHWQLAIITNDRSLPSQLRLKEKRKTPLFNGDIECRLFQFDLTTGSYRTPK